MARLRRSMVNARLVVLPLVLVSLFAAALPGAVAQNLTSDTAALLALRDALDPGRRLPWDPTTAPNPCVGQWRGVVCDAQGGRVVELRLPGKGLVGTIPAGTLGNLTALQKLSLRFNAISGEIPADVGNCGELRGVFLRGNRIAGVFPEGFFALAQLRKVDLAANRLTGGVPLDFNRLARLDTLFLEGNELGGTLPAGLNIRKLAPGRFNVSLNAQLTGPVPASLARMPATAFVGTGLCGGPLAACATPPPSSGSNSRKMSRWAIIGIVAGAVVVILLIVGLFAFLRRRRGSQAGSPAGAAADVHTGTAPITVTMATTDRDTVKQSHSHSHSGPPLAPAMISDGKKLVFLGSALERPYDLETLLRASAEVLSKGVHGTTYRATLDGGEPVVAIKRLREVHIPEHEFRDKAAALGALHHDNLPRLCAYFYSKEEKLLVYDFVGAGSLSSLLHDNGAEGRARLDFTARARIALAVSRAVAFIHRGGTSSSHGNIKASNIVVTSTRDGAYASGYGIPRLVGAASLPRRGAGYRAPEVVDPRAVPQSADVYSYGVVVLELLSGRAPAHALPDGADGVDLPRWVRSVVQEEWTSEVFDSAIGNEPRVEDEMMRLLQLGMECTEQRPERRPVMAEVEARIERVVEDACRKADFSSTDGSRSVSA